jgi:hypothetical protein
MKEEIERIIKEFSFQYDDNAEEIVISKVGLKTTCTNLARFIQEREEKAFIIGALIKDEYSVINNDGEIVDDPYIIANFEDYKNSKEYSL